MTELLDKAIEVARGKTVDEQDDIARMILDVFDEGPAEAIPPEHRKAVLEGLAQADRGEFASDEEVAEAFRRFRQ